MSNCGEPLHLIAAAWRFIKFNFSPTAAAGELRESNAEGLAVLRWLFRRSVTRERAVAIATDLLAANGCRVFATEAEVIWGGDYIPMLFKSVSIPGRRWYVNFERVMPPGVWTSNAHTTVYVWADSGHATFAHFEGWE